MKATVDARSAHADDLAGAGEVSTAPGAAGAAANGADGGEHPHDGAPIVRDSSPPPKSVDVIGKVERRTFRVQEIRVEQRADGGALLTGYAAVFDSVTDAMADWGFREVVRPGAFRKTIQEADVRALINHDSNLLLGRTRSGTLRLSEDAHGLRIEIDTPDTSYARDLLESMRRGDLDQMSFAFRTIKDRWTQELDQLALRELLEVELYDVSPVTFPAYPETHIEMNLRAHLIALLGRAQRGEASADERAVLVEIAKRLQEMPAEPVVDHSADEAGREATSDEALKLKVQIAMRANNGKRRS